MHCFKVVEIRDLKHVSQELVPDGKLFQIGGAANQKPTHAPNHMIKLCLYLCMCVCVFVCMIN